MNLLENILKEENIDFVSVHGSQNKKEQVENMQKVKTSSLILAFVAIIHVEETMFLPQTSTDAVIRTRAEERTTAGTLNPGLPT